VPADPSATPFSLTMTFIFRLTAYICNLT
jgi:hypothetical protein